MSLFKIESDNNQTKDWTGSSASAFKQLGASNHSETERETNDFYATDPIALEKLLEKLKEDNVILNKNIWECACGQGHLSNVLKQHGYDVYSTDLIDRNYCDNIVDFLSCKNHYNGTILTNPPYKYALEFVLHALDLVNSNNYVVMFLKIQFLEGQERYKVFQKFPPKYIYIHSSRIRCYLNGNMTERQGSATCYCWFIWQKDWFGEPVIRWLK